MATWNAGMLPFDDLVEAVTAFMEKRPAEFTGRYAIGTAQRLRLHRAWPRFIRASSADLLE